MPSDAARSVFHFEAGSYGPEDLLVARFQGSEGISELFHFDLELASQNHQIDFEAAVGKKALLSWTGPAGERRIRGLVSHLEQTGQSRRYAHYRASLVPTIWALSLKRNSRIFQGMGVKEIVAEVFKRDNVAGDLFRFSLKHPHPAREYCVQYRESDLDFVSRLLEEEGIFYFFEHGEKTDVLVMADDPVAHVPIPGTAAVVYRDPATNVPEAEQVLEFRYGHRMRQGAVDLGDFDFKRPSLRLRSDAKAAVETSHEYYDYPGEYVDQKVGDALAKVRLEELRAERALGIGRSDCLRFLPGFRFTLEDHPRADFNREYLLVRVRHMGHEPQVVGEETSGPGAELGKYYNTFESIPAFAEGSGGGGSKQDPIAYRPPRRTRCPRVEGPQTAIVVGPSGEEIYTDEHGRVRVQFHWDREGKIDDKSSCWVRVSQGWAGAGWGIVFLPRIGQEVVVDFLEGDPDQPLITGRVYNGENAPPYALPGEKTKSTIKSNTSPGGGGYNELRFEDAAGSEEIWLHGQKDWNIVIEHDKTQKIGHDEKLEVGNNRSKTVGVDQDVHIGKNYTETVGGNESETIKGDRAIDVVGSHTETIGGDQGVTVGGSGAWSIGGNGSITIGAAGVISVAAALAEDVGAKYSLSVADDATIGTGGDMSMSVGKKCTVSVDDAMSLAVKKNLTESVDKEMKVTVKEGYGLEAKKIVIEAKEEISLKTGDASIVMKKNGDIQIKGKKIMIKGSGDVVIKGSKIAEN